jgi:branched-chain amino acid transport system ATP-binding protein
MAGDVAVLADGHNAPPSGSESLAPLLGVEEVTVRFGGVVANNQVTMSCRPGAITALLGPNGAGKSTLFNVITGAQRPNEGGIFFEGNDITGLPAHGRARLGIARTFQNLSVVHSVSVLENVEMGAARFRRYGSAAGLLALPISRRQDRILREIAWRALETTGLAAVAHRPAGDLAYGDLRRLEIARALALGPRVLLLDEPTAGMDRAETEELGAALLALRDQWALTILVVEHDLALVRQVAQDAWVLDFGTVLAGGPLGQVMRDKNVISAYLGRSAGGA